MNMSNVIMGIKHFHCSAHSPGEATITIYGGRRKGPEVQVNCHVTPTSIAVLAGCC